MPSEKFDAERRARLWVNERRAKLWTNAWFRRGDDEQSTLTHTSEKEDLARLLHEALAAGREEGEARYRDLETHYLALKQAWEAQQVAQPGTDPAACPACKASLVGGEIPTEQRVAYGGHSHFSRAIAVYSIRADKIVAWRCPKCDHQW